jgi:predicted restriction endonuclease
VKDLLRASHVKPWAKCLSDEERLDVYNGLLLAPHLDAAFDKGFITVEDDGQIVLSSALNDESRGALDFEMPMRVRRLQNEHLVYLRWHRENLFQK